MFIGACSGLGRSCNSSIGIELLTQQDETASEPVDATCPNRVFDFNRSFCYPLLPNTATCGPSEVYRGHQFHLREPRSTHM